MSVWPAAGSRGEGEIDVKRSRFLAVVARVDDEEAARAVIAEARRAHPMARHHCSAMILDQPGAQPILRSSDDGEPAGTAGGPMLEVLRGAGLARVGAVVTRYFGGVLLGTGGLVRAYSDAVAAALVALPLVRPEPVSLVRIRLGHERYGRAQADLLAAGFDVVSAEFGTEVVLLLSAPVHVDAAAVLARVLHGEVEPELAGTAVREVPLN